MRHRFTLYALLLMLLILAISTPACVNKPQPAIQWYRTFGEGTDVYGSSVQQTTDGGYVICGRIFSYKTSPEGGACLIKTDAEGNKLWVKIFGAEEGAFGHSGQQTADGGYILCGSISRKAPGEGGIWLIKTDADGNKLWDKAFGAGWGYSVQQTNDGGYIVCGESGQHIRLLKTDTEGTTIWDKTFVGQYIDQGNQVQQTTDGGYIVCGSTRPLVQGWIVGKPNVWLIKTDSEGNKLWDKIFGGKLYAEGASVQQTTDGGYIICGTGETEKATGILDTILDQALGTLRPLLIKTDAEGNKLWGSTLDRGSGFSAQQTTDGGYIVCGQTFFGKGWLIKTDADGNKLWDKTFKLEITGVAQGLSVKQTRDGGYIMSGTVSFAGSNHVLLLKISPVQ